MKQRLAVLLISSALAMPAVGANLTTVTVTAGVPTSGTGTVSTLDNLLGTAGSPSSNVQSIQGVVSGTAVPISAASLPLPTGAATSAKQDTINTTLGSPFQAGGSIGNTTFAATQATASNLKAQVVTPAADPCQGVAKTSVPISQAANTKLFSATSAKKNYICSIMVIAGDAENLSLVEGTGSTCGTSTAAIIGGTTAANGPNFAANGGFTMGNGNAVVAAGANNNYDVCLFQSGSGRVAGVLTYVQQ